MAELVQEHEQQQADGDDEPGHATASLSSASARARSVGLDELVEIARGRAVGALERVGDDLGDAEERQPAREERRDGDLVRGVVRARIRAALLPRLAREREHRERLEVGRLELERERGEVERRQRRRGALRDT